jgi:SAM-dependent methyltransferase
LTTATRRNLEYYGELKAGRADYWRLMAAPRARVRTIVAALRQIQPRTVVDLGCGDGSLLRAIASELPDAKLAGIDLSAAQIEENRASSPGIAWHAGNVEDESIPVPGVFDAIVSSEVVEHLENPLAFLASARRLAVEGATLILSTQSGLVRETERRVGHLRHFTAQEMRELLVKAGWEPVRVWNSGGPFHNLSKWAANLRPDAAMREFGEKPYGPLQRFAVFVLRALFLLNSRSRGAQLYAIAKKPR